jgi:hypothetical protein
MKSLVHSIYNSHHETKRMILLSIMMLLSFNEEFQRQFLKENGPECLLLLMSQADDFHCYVAAKSFVLMSRVESSLNRIGKRSVCTRVVEYSINRDRRILKEGLRFFINILIHKRPKTYIIEMVCSLINQVL